MAQGHALSCFARAYEKSKNPKYFEDLLNVMQVYKIHSEEGGIKNYIFDDFIWFEEYPMLPNGQFVLRGNLGGLS